MPSRSPKGFLIAASALAATQLAGAVFMFRMDHDEVVECAILQAIPYAIFALLLWRASGELTPERSRRCFFYLLCLGVVMRGAVLFATPHSTDVYRYVWDGRVQAQGINPYRYVPADPALEGLRDHDIYLGVNRKTYARTIYPPMAQVVFFVASRFSETVTMMKLAMIAFEALLLWALVRLLAARGQPVILASLYVLHPLPVWEIAGSGHVDIVAAAFSMVALLLAEKGKRGWSGAALAAGVLSKYFPLSLTPAIYKRWDWKMPAAFAITAAALYLPYISVGKGVLGFLGGYADEEFKGGSGFYIAALLKEAGLGAASFPIFLALATAVLLVLAWRSGFRKQAEKPDLRGAFAIAVAFTFFFSPHYPWYFLWLVPFLCFFPSPAVFWLTLSAPVLYWSGLPDSLLGASVQYVPFAFLLIMENLKLFTPKEAPNGRAFA
jgi:hypothetical protein